VPQSNVIFFFVFAAFFVFITLRGELPKYMGFLFASPATGSNLGGTIRTGTSALSGTNNPTVLGSLY
jgi:hypothetical protein